MSVALEAARKYHYIEGNPARDIITKFGKQGKTTDPYTIEQMQQLFARATGTRWELPIVLSGLYGLRLGEVIGLRWDNVDFENKTINITEQLPFERPVGLTIVEEMAPVKSEARLLSMTEYVRPFLERYRDMQEYQKELTERSGDTYYDNRLVVCKGNGVPLRRESISTEFAQMLRRQGLIHIRFHDLRHSAATNMFQLTGDFYTVEKILGHSLKGVGIQLGISTSLDATTARYIDVRSDRM